MLEDRYPAGLKSPTHFLDMTPRVLAHRIENSPAIAMHHCMEHDVEIVRVHK